MDPKIGRDIDLDNISDGYESQVIGHHVEIRDFSELQMDLS